MKEAQVERPSLLSASLASTLLDVTTLFAQTAEMTSFLFPTALTLNAVY